MAHSEQVSKGESHERRHHSHNHPVAAAVKIFGPILFVLGVAFLVLSQVLLLIATQRLERAKCFAIHGAACVKTIRNEGA